MRNAVQLVRSAVFIGQMYLAGIVFVLVFLPWALIHKDGALAACQLYCRWIILTARLIVGLRTEVRGPVPQGEALVAAKHQSFFDIIILMAALPRPRFVMKAEIRRIPLVGFYAMRIGCVPVERGRRGAAITTMLADVQAGRQAPGQLVIYPQGTRVAPGAALPYKTGVAAIYGQLGQPCVPVATNVGVFWPRRGLLRRPGVAVIEFLSAIPPAMRLNAFLPELEARIESASDALMTEAGFHVPPKAVPDGD